MKRGQAVVRLRADSPYRVAENPPKALLEGSEAAIRGRLERAEAQEAAAAGPRLKAARREELLREARLEREASERMLEEVESNFADGARLAGEIRRRLQGGGGDPAPAPAPASGVRSSRGAGSEEPAAPGQGTPAKASRTPGKASRRPRKGAVKPAAVEVQLADGVVLKVDAEAAEAVRGLVWRPHRVAETGLTYWAARRPEGGEVFLGVFVAGLGGQEVKPGQLVVHLNGDLADARRENLLVAFRGLAMQRRVVPKRGGASVSRYIGVNQVLRKGEPTGKWMAKIRLWNPQERVSGTVYLRSWDSEEEAAEVYDAAAVQIHGEAARVNFPEQSEGQGWLRR